MCKQINLNQWCEEKRESDWTEINCLGNICTGKHAHKWFTRHIYWHIASLHASCYFALRHDDDHDDGEKEKKRKERK